VASILHADLDSFFASVEQRDDPSLRGQPVIVGGGVVLAASYEAKAFGVRSAMGGREARRLCPHAVVVPPRMSAYTEASRAVFEVFADTTPFVEGVSIDEAFLDVGGLRRIAGTPVDIARSLRARVRADVGLPITVGVATTKFLAKVASAVGKPDGLLEVPAGDELAFLHPLPIERLWGVGPKTSVRLRDRGITTVGELARLTEPSLSSMLGPAAAHHLHAVANNSDPRRVQTARRRRSIGSQRALGRTPRTEAELDAILVGLVDRVAGRMRAADRVGRTVVLRLRFEDFARATRSHTMAEATAQSGLILAALRAVLRDARALTNQRGVTLLGISVTNLDDDDAVQLPLPFEPRSPRDLDQVVDDVREKFGRAALTQAVLLGRSPGVEMPMLPD
jgi:DNA polymerase-4